jgi:hypothetical protein
MKVIAITAIAAAAMLAAIEPAAAQRGPVYNNCQRELARYCAGVPHFYGEARSCLVQNRARLSATCRRALAYTGGGRGWGRGCGWGGCGW